MNESGALLRVNKGVGRPTLFSLGTQVAWLHAAKV